ncbi:MAG: winged helix-turn-helix domain-containing protein [Pseudomonadota bacterium]
MGIQPAQVLLADGDRIFSRGLSKDFRDAGFRVQSANSGEQAIDMVEDGCPDLIVTERKLPGLSGIELCRHLKGRPETRALPILMTATDSDHVDLARALDIGADDFVHKPVTAIELVARARALLRRAKPMTVAERLEYEDLVVELDTYRAFRNGNLLKLGPTEFNILCAFMGKPGRVWTRDQLLDAVWGPNTFIDSRTVDVHVGRLRKTIRNNGVGDPFRTVRGAGYALG